MPASKPNRTGLADRMVNNVLIIAGIYVLLPFLYIARYDHPSADDYSYSITFSAQGLLHTFRESYLFWSGRYFSHVISWFNPTRYHSLGYYRLFAVCLILIFAGAVVWMIRSLTKEYLSFRQVLGLSGLFIFLYFSKAPSIPEAFYWFTSSSIYQLANIFMMLLLATLVRLKTNAKPSLLLWCSVLCVAVIGCNEVSLIITVLFICFYALSQYIKSRRPDIYFTSLCGVCLIFAAIEILAPGNYMRMGVFKRSMLWTFVGSLSISGVYLSQWITPIVIATVLYIPLFGISIARGMADTNRMFDISLRKFLWYYIGTVCFLLVFIVWVADGSSLGRIFDVIYLYVLLGYFFFLQILLCKNISRLEKWDQYKKGLSLLGLAVFLAGLFDINNNVSTAYIDVVSGKAKEYDHALSTRERTVKECVSDTCFVPALPDAPATIFYTDLRPLSDAPGLWITGSYAKYLDKHVVIIDGRPPVPATNQETIRNLGKSIRSHLLK